MTDSDKSSKICTGCGSTQTIKEIRQTHPKAISCCPERVMVDRKAFEEMETLNSNTFVLS